MPIATTSENALLPAAATLGPTENTSENALLPAAAALGPTESTSETALSPAALADLWAGRVRASMRKTFTGVLETGKILLQAKAALPHRQWLPMLE
jgi:hypothetical protein